MKFISFTHITRGKALSLTNNESCGPIIKNLTSVQQQSCNFGFGLQASAKTLHQEKEQYKNNTTRNYWDGGSWKHLSLSHYLFGRMPQGPQSKAQNAPYLEIFKTSHLIYFSVNLPVCMTKQKLQTRNCRLLNDSVIRLLKQKVCAPSHFEKRNGWGIFCH